MSNDLDLKALCKNVSNPVALREIKKMAENIEDGQLVYNQVFYDVNNRKNCEVKVTFVVKDGEIVDKICALQTEIYHPDAPV